MTSRRWDSFQVDPPIPVDTPPGDHPQVQAWPLTEPPDDGSFRLLSLHGLVPVHLAVAVMLAANDAIEKAGYDAFVKDTTGIGVLWVRKRKA